MYGIFCQMRKILYIFFNQKILPKEAFALLGTNCDYMSIFMLSPFESVMFAMVFVSEHDLINLLFHMYRHVDSFRVKQKELTLIKWCKKQSVFISIYNWLEQLHTWRVCFEHVLKNQRKNCRNWWRPFFEKEKWLNSSWTMDFWTYLLRKWKVFSY